MTPTILYYLYAIARVDGQEFLARLAITEIITLLHWFYLIFIYYFASEIYSSNASDTCYRRNA